MLVHVVRYVKIRTGRYVLIRRMNLFRILCCGAARTERDEITFGKEKSSKKRKLCFVCGNCKDRPQYETDEDEARKLNTT